MPKDFISHSWEDNNIARKIAEDIKPDGAEIWIDYARITGGESLPDRISEALEWCDTLILVWSKSAANSYYVKLELQSALDLKKRIIPCLIDTAVKHPAILRGLLYIDFHIFDHGYQELCHALRLKVSKARVQLSQVENKFKKEPQKDKLPTDEAPAKKRTIFRSQPNTLSIDNVKVLLQKHNFYCKKYNWNKDFSNPNGRGFANQFEPKTIKGDKVVIDRASGLMWQQGGASNEMPFEKAKEWINKLNRNNYAGFNDWRLQTLEEAMSLMEPMKLNGDLYIEPVFDLRQWWIWTVDLVKGESGVAWVVYFGGGCCTNNPFYNPNYFRSVRFRQSSE